MAQRSSNDGKIILSGIDNNTLANNVAVSVTDGGLNVYLGKTGTSSNRNINNASTTYDASTNKVTWTVGENITELRVVSFNASGVVWDYGNAAYLVVINSADDLQANTLLTATGGVGTAVDYEIGLPLEELIINRTTPITRLDVLPLNVNQRFVIGAV